jgi:hypothetical protein
MGGTWSTNGRATCYLPRAGFLLGLFFHPEDGSDMFFETSIDFQRTAWRYIPEDRTSNHTIDRNW